MHTTTLYTITIPPMLNGLRSLDTLLDTAARHAESKKTAFATFEHALLDERIVFDQFNFKKQVQITCDLAKGTAARLAQIDNPKHDDTETTIAELKTRIEKTIAFIESVTPEQIVGKEDIKVTLPFFPGKYFTGFGYATAYALPNFYFHLSTAYNLLRKNGIAIGKTDYLGSLPLNNE